MTDLVAVYQANDLARFERVLRANAAAVRGDAFVAAHVGELRRRVREGVLLSAARPYARVRLAHLGAKLGGIDAGEVEQLLVGLILDGRIQGRIDQVRDDWDERAFFSSSASSKKGRAGGERRVAAAVATAARRFLLSARARSASSVYRA